jgi:hypothetical protein
MMKDMFMFHLVNVKCCSLKNSFLRDNKVGKEMLFLD